MSVFCNHFHVFSMKLPESLFLIQWTGKETGEENVLNLNNLQQKKKKKIETEKYFQVYKYSFSNRYLQQFYKWEHEKLNACWHSAEGLTDFPKIMPLGKQSKTKQQELAVFRWW